jgi:hypothetical protein
MESHKEWKKIAEIGVQFPEMHVNYTRNILLRSDLIEKGKPYKHPINGKQSMHYRWRDKK